MTLLLVDENGVPADSAQRPALKNPEDIEVCKECIYECYCWRLYKARWKGEECKTCKLKRLDKARRDRGRRSCTQRSCKTHGKVYGEKLGE